MLCEMVGVGEEKGAGFHQHVCDCICILEGGGKGVPKKLALRSLWDCKFGGKLG